MTETESLTSKLSAIFSPHNNLKGPGVVVGINKNNENVYRGAYGLASIEHNMPNTLDTRMRIGSTCKQFTCFGILLLQDESKLSIDDPINKFIGGLDNYQFVPTIKQLMNHTSGIRDVQDEAFQAAGVMPQPKNRIIPAIKQQHGVVFKPGEGQLYSNAGYYLLSEIIEKVSGLSFADYMESCVFKPLGMTNTNVVLSDMEIHPDVATFHLPTASGKYRRGLLPNEETSGCGGVISNVEDMLAWAKALRTETALLSNHGWQQLKSTSTLNNGLHSDYGLGIWHITYRGIDTLQHAGGVIGGNTQLMVIEDEALDIVVMTNTDTIPSTVIANQALELLLENKLEPHIAPASSEGLSHLYGEFYKNDKGVIFGFDDVGGFMGLSIHLSPCAPVLKKKDDTYTTSFNDLAMGPFSFETKNVQPNSDGNAPNEVIISECGYADTFIKQNKDWHPDTDELASFTGEYYCVDMDTFAHISHSNEKLAMRFIGKYGVREHILEPRLENIFLALAVDDVAPTQHPIIFERNSDSVASFLTSSVRARERRFVRIKQ